MEMIVNRANPVSRWRLLAALLNYFVGYSYVYPWLMEWLTWQIWHISGIVDILMWITLIGTLISTVWLLWPYFSESWNAFKALGWRLIPYLAGYEVLMIATMVVTSNLIYILTEQVQSANQVGIEITAQSLPALTIFASCIFAPFVEEALFRGILYRSLRSKTGVLAATVVSGTMFGLLHVYYSLLNGMWSDGIFILTYGAMGMVFCLLYEKTQSIWPCVCLHLLHNSISMALLLI